MTDLASYFAGGRNMLHMNVKTLAKVVRLSDRTITELENSADPQDARTREIKRALEDFGVIFSDQGDGRYALSLDPRAGRKRFTFSGPHQTNVAAALEEFKRSMALVGRLGWQELLLDKSKAGTKDSVDIFVPVRAQQIAIEAIREHVRRNGPITMVASNGDSCQISAETVDTIFA